MSDLVKPSWQLRKKSVNPSHDEDIDSLSPIPRPKPEVPARPVPELPAKSLPPLPVMVAVPPSDPSASLTTVKTADDEEKMKLRQKIQELMAEKARLLQESEMLAQKVVRMKEEYELEAAERASMMTTTATVTAHAPAASPYLAPPSHLPSSTSISGSGLGHVLDTVSSGTSHVLHAYHSLSDKITLLDLAVSRSDSHVLLAVVLFIKDTLRRDLFLEHVRQRPDAIRAYAAYLDQSEQWDDLARLYREFRMPLEEGMLMLRRAYLIQDGFARGQALQSCCEFFKKHDALKWHAQQLTDQMDLLERQWKIDEYDSKVAEAGKDQIYVTYPRTNILHRPLHDTLSYCIFYHAFAEKSKLSSPLGLQDRFQITEKRYVRVYLNSRARIGDWESVKKIATNKGLFSSKFKSPIGFHPFVEAVCEWGGPEDLKMMFLGLIENPGTRYDVAIKYNIYKTAIEALIEMKDKEQLEHLRQHLVNSMTEYESQPWAQQIDAALFNPKMKWR